MSGRTGALGLHLAWVMLSLRGTSQTNAGIRAAPVILPCLGDEQVPGSSAHQRAAELEPHHWGLDVPPG